jgi:lysozyme
MDVDDAALDLIRRFEGLRLDASRCPAGIWTIGYGHTAAAGPPEVRPGQRITVAEAERLLRADAARIAGAIRPMITREVSRAQFAALVSFAFNVGPSAFRRSSVLKAVNAGDFERVPQRLALWVKANGRTLPGLIRRRAAEAAVFASAAGAGQDARSRPEPSRGKPMRRSTTVWAAMVSALAAAASALAPAAPRTVSFLVIAAAAAAATWIVIERRRKAMEDGV